MARFSQQFLAQTASPTFGRGLFDLAQNIGGLGAMRAQNEAARQKQQMLASLNPQQLAAYELQQAAASGDAKAVASAQDKLTGLQASSIASSVAQEDSPKVLRAAAARIRSIPNASESAIRRAEELETRAAAAAERMLELQPITVEATRKNAAAELSKITNERERRSFLAEQVEQPELKRQILQGNKDVINRVERSLVDTELETDKETPRDYSLTKQEISVYQDLMEDKDIKNILTLSDTTEILGFDVPISKEADVNQNVLFDEAERIRTADPDITKKEALIQALNKQVASQTKPNWYSSLDAETKTKVDQARLNGYSDEEIKAAINAG